MTELPTVKVKRDGPKGYRIINASAFDPAVHELVDGQAPITEEPAALAAEASVGGEQAEMTDAELRAAVEAKTGKAPHWKLSRDKLLAALEG